MKKIKLLSLLLFAIAFLNINCKKQGPAGVAGATGPAGPAGPQGPAGTTNVIYSAITPFVPGNWSAPDGGTPINRRYYYIYPQGLTYDLSTRGVVLLFLNVTNDSRHYALPGSFSFDGINRQQLNYDFSVPPTIRLDLSNTNNTLDPGVIGSNYSYRYIYIPGSILSGLTADPVYRTPEQLKKMSYKEVCAMYNIPE